MIERYGRIVGVKLFRFGNYQAELWFCPRGESIPMHVHHGISSHLYFIAGQMRWAGCGKIRTLSGFKDCFKNWVAPPEEPHGAVVTGRFGIFLNIETWTIKPTSASRDIQLV